MGFDDKFFTKAFITLLVIVFLVGAGMYGLIFDLLPQLFQHFGWTWS